MTNIPRPQKRRFYKRWWFWLILILLAMTASSVGGGMITYKKAQLASYDYLQDAVRVQKRTIRKTISASGVIVADAASPLSFGVPVTIDEVLVAVGDNVDKGAVLLKAGRNEVTSPFDGRVSSIATFVGDTVAPGTPVLEVSYRSTHVEFLASDAEVLELAVGQNTNVTIPAYQKGKKEYTEKVTFVDVKKQVAGTALTAGAGQAAESGYNIKISAANLPAEIKNTLGLTVDLEVIIAEQKDVFSLDTGAVQYATDDNSQAFVYLVPTIDEEFLRAAGKTDDITIVLTRKNIVVGFTGDNYMEIKEGLLEGDEVLLYVPLAAKTTTSFF